MSIVDGSLDTANHHIRQTISRRGSTLIWVMVVVLVMIIALGIGLAAVSRQLNLSAVRHEEHQAYYTALSSTDTVAAWITENADGSGQGEAAVIDLLFERITDAAPDGVTIDEAGLPPEAGTCTVNLRWTDAAETQLKITSTATFAGVTETVSLTLNRLAPNTSAFEGELKVSSFDIAKYDADIARIRGLTSGGIVPLYEATSADNSTKNGDDIATLNSQISDINSTKEARWTNVNVNSASGGHNASVLGTQRYPVNLARTTHPETDNRRFMVPINGKIMIDPLEDGGIASREFTSLNNTKISSLAIDNTAGKDILFRLASGSAAMGNGASQNRSKSYLNSLLLLNFTDDAGNTETTSYRLNGVDKTYSWHPNNWNRLDVYVQPNSKVTSNIILGPFGHKFDSYLDYWSWGNFVDNWHGTTANEYTTLWPYALSPSTNGGNYLGLPIFAVDYGKNANFWILDGSLEGTFNGTTTPYFRIMQGVNIIEGTVYSTRSTIIGGGLRRSDTTGKTMENVNEGAAGYSLAASNIHSLYVDATVRYSQFICNTDIILMTPSAGLASSVIRRPYTWADKTVSYHSFDQNFNPTMTITGGSIYVGDKQTLTIQGATIDNMWISPDEIVVAQGGALTIESSAFTNILTDIYVDGGTLTIRAGAKIKGNIYAYNGGTVKVEGVFQLDSPSTLEPERARDGLLVYGTETVGTTFKDKDGNGFAEITKAGQLETPATLTAITGTSGRVHLVGGEWAALVPKTPVAALEGTYAKNFLCEGYDTKTGCCPHYDGRPVGSGGWTVGAYGDS